MTGGTMLVTGILSIILGIVIVFWPDATLEVGLMVLGIIAVLTGIFGISATFNVDKRAMALYIALILLGLVMIIIPQFVADIAAFIFAILLLIIGVGQLSEMGRPLSGNRTVSVELGILFIVLGMIIIMFPDQTIKAAMWIFGVFLVFSGALLVTGGVRMGALRNFCRQ